MKFKMFDAFFKMNRIVYGTLFLFILSNQNFAQKYKITTNRTEVSNFEYSVSDTKTYKWYAGFYFPEYDYTDSVIQRAIKPITRRNKDTPNFIQSNNLWDISLKRNIECHLGTTFFYLRYYINNIRSVDIYIHSSRDRWYVYKVIPEFQKYQIPVNTDFSVWESLNNSNLNLFNSDTVNQKKIDRIIFSIALINPKEKYQFFVADFKIYDAKFLSREVNHPFFDKWVNKKNSLAEIEYNSFYKEPGQHIILSPFLIYTTAQLQSNKFNITSLDDSLNKREMLYDVFLHIFEKYPFYDERNINKNEIIEKFNNLFYKDSLEYGALEDNIRTLIDEFHDPHFYVHPKKASQETVTLKADGPIRIIEINNEFYIASIFDAALNNKIKVGLKVLNVDGIDTHHLIDSLSNNYRGTNEVRRNKAITNSLKRFKKDTCILTLANFENDTFQVGIPYDKKNIIPEGFIVKQGTLKTPLFNTTYFKLNHCIGGTYILFLNNFNDIKKRPNLILDLRNASGGEENEIIKIASCFITKPSVYNHYIYNIRDSYDLKETTVLEPNKEFNLSELNVFILVNERTACAFEAFVGFIKKHVNTIIIGTSKTAGSYSCSYDLNFPWGLTCSFNSLGKPILSNGTFIENKGIEPDVWVSINKVEELAPYDDKVLKTALRLISQKSESYLKKKTLIK